MVPYGPRLTSALVALLVPVIATGSFLAYWQGSAHQRAAADTRADGSGTSRQIGTADTTGAVRPELSPAAQAAPHSREVSDLVARYFTAINRLDYDAWLTTVTTAQSQRNRESWRYDYQTTQDVDIYISDIAPGDPVTVRI